MKPIWAKEQNVWVETYSAFEVETDVFSCHHLFSHLHVESNLAKDTEDATFEALDRIVLVAKNEVSFIQAFDLQVDASRCALSSQSVHFLLIICNL